MTDTAGHGLVESDLPTFRRPPVVEVSLAVSYEPLEGMGPFQVARLHAERYAAAGFARVEERTPAAMPVERFGRKARMPDIRFELVETPPPPRMWFVNESGNQVVQLQRDFFARNWRRAENDSQYPRYPSLRQPFQEDLASLASFVQDNGLGAIKPVQCELIYVNEIRPVESVWTDHGDLSSVVRIWRDDEARTFLPKAEEARFEVSYLMEHQDEPFGRLRVSLQPAFTIVDDQPVFILTLTARGHPVIGDLDGVLDFMDFGHAWIVRAFESVTTDAMHQEWEKE